LPIAGGQRKEALGKNAKINGLKERPTARFHKDRSYAPVRKLGLRDPEGLTDTGKHIGNPR